MRKHILGLSVLVALVSFSSLAFAGYKAVPDQAARQASFHQKFTPEQSETLHKIFAAHRDKIHQLRTDFWAKKTELKALVASGKAERSDIQGLISEMTTLRNAKYEEHKAIMAEINEAGIKGFHFHHRGFHHGNNKFENRLG